MKPTKKQLFKRQITLSEIGESGQKKLQNTSVLVVGCGGLGSLISVFLATSGIKKIHLVDFDTVGLSNLHRQVFFSLKDVGKPKAKVLSKFIKKRAPFTQVTTTNSPVTKQNIFKLINQVDVVVDATDSLPTKYVLNDACVIKKKPLVYGSLYKYDGYVATFNVLQKDGSYSANLRDAFPKIATNVLNCEQIGTLNSIVGTIATLQVNEVLKLITNVGTPLINELLIYNSLKNSQLKIKLKPTFLKPKIERIFKEETYFDVACQTQNKAWLISSKKLKKQLLSKQKPIVISLITKEIDYPFKVDKHITFLQISNIEFVPKKDEKYVLVCMQGNTSYTATKLLKEKHPDANVFSLAGGITNY